MGGIYLGFGYDLIDWGAILGSGTTAEKPTASSANVGYQYFDTTLNKLQRSDGANWVDIASFNAGDIIVTPAGNITVSNTQAALQELDTKKYRNQTPAASANKSGASVAPDFTSNLTLQYTLTDNITSFAAATGLNDGETGMIVITIGAYALPANPPSGAYKGSWIVTGTLVRIIIERVGSTYIWTADSVSVVA